MEGLSKAFLLKSEGGGFTPEHSNALGSDIPPCTAATPSPRADLVFVWVTWERQEGQTSSCSFPATVSLLG